MKKGYPRESRQELADKIIKKHGDLPSFWRNRYRDRMKEIISLRLQVTALQTELKESVSDTQNHKPDTLPSLQKTTNKLDTIDEMKCSIISYMDICIMANACLVCLVINSGLNQLKGIRSAEYLRFFLNYFFSQLIKLCASNQEFRYSMATVTMVAEVIKECHDVWVLAPSAGSRTANTAETVDPDDAVSTSDIDCLAISSSFFSYLLAWFYALSNIKHYNIGPDLPQACADSLVNLVSISATLRKSNINNHFKNLCFVYTNDFNIPVFLLLLFLTIIDGVYLLGQFLLHTGTRTNLNNKYVVPGFSALERRCFLSFTWCIHSAMRQLLVPSCQVRKSPVESDVAGTKSNEIQDMLQRNMINKLKDQIIVYMLYSMEDSRVRLAFLNLPW